MRSFSDRAWTPLGSRPHIFVALPELATLQEAYARIAHVGESATVRKVTQGSEQ